MTESSMVLTTVHGSTFEHPPRYTHLAHLGMGVQGHVSSAEDTLNAGTRVAIKRIHEPFHADDRAKRTYREIKGTTQLLLSLKHPNIVGVHDMYIAPSSNVYIVFEFIEVTLAEAMQRFSLQDAHCQHFMFQLFCGLQYMHSAGVIHRDLKPTNLLINLPQMQLKIADFGLARDQHDKMTGFVVPRYYRAPEVMLSWQQYDRAIDIWSAGCLLAEMKLGQPLFAGGSEIGQLLAIARIMGKPPQDVIDAIQHPETARFVRDLADLQAQPLDGLIPQLSQEDLLNRMFDYHWNQRITAELALYHPYLATYRQHITSVSNVPQFDWTALHIERSRHAWKDMVMQEIRSLQPQ